MPSYYSQNLSASRLKRVYEIAPERTRQYLKAEVEFVTSRIKPGDRVLDLGCGYGRVMPDFLDAGAEHVAGIDSSVDNIVMGREYLAGNDDWSLSVMSAEKLGFRDGIFEITAAIQNGISAFQAEPLDLIREAVRVTKPGGRVLFSTYSPRFWDYRLEWFKLQADEGLLGEIDGEMTKEGLIVCKDGFRAMTYSEEQLRGFARALGLTAQIEEVDESSLFLEVEKG